MNEKCPPCQQGWHSNCQPGCPCLCWRTEFAAAICMALSMPPRPDQLQHNP